MTNIQLISKVISGLHGNTRSIVLVGMVFLCGLFFCVAPGYAEVRVFVDFASDVDNGPPSGGGSNGTADWIENLDVALADAGLSPSTAAERATVEAAITTSLETSYSEFDVTFSTTAPATPYHTLNFGATSSSGTSFGSAPLDFRNTSATQTCKVYSHNFDSYFYDSGDIKSEFLGEIQLALAGTGAHELGHSLGLQHHHTYSDPGIQPANYGNTLGLQNQYILATGSTGLNEAERESQRSFSVFEKVILEAASNVPAVTVLPYTAEEDFAYDTSYVDGVSDDPIVTSIDGSSSVSSNPLPATYEELDAGNGPTTAQALTLTKLPISKTKAALVVDATLESETDVDFYSFPGKAGNLLIAQVYSYDRYTDKFDGMLTLFDTDGVTELATNDDITYSGDAFDNGTFRENDPFLLNIPLLNTGTYFLKIEASPSAGSSYLEGDYDLIFAIPEPATVSLLVMGLLSLSCGRGPRNSKKTLSGN